MANNETALANPTTGLIDELDLDNLDLETMVREEVGYYPYFTPALYCSECKHQIQGRDIFCLQHPEAELIGNRFYGTVIAVDENLDEPNEKERFVRFTIQSQAKTFNAQSGPKNSPEIIQVKKGEFFTIGEYGTLPLRRYMGKTLLVTVTGKRPPSAKNPKYSPSFVFDVRVDKATALLLDAERQELTRLALEAHKSRQLAQSGIVNGQMTGGQKSVPALPASTTPAS